MATRSEQSEQEFQQEINAAIAGTEEEIFREAMDASLDDNDGDHELEDMGDGLEGDHIDEEIEVDDPDEPHGEDNEDVVDEADDEAEEDENEGDEQEENENQNQQRDERGRFEPQVPPGRLRESNERARRAEQAEQRLRGELATVNARLNDVMTRLNTAPVTQQQPTQQQAPQKPDMFVDPDGYEKWVLEQATSRAQQALDQRLQQRDQQQQDMANRRIDQSFANAARSNRGFEFTPAYNALASLDPKNPQDRATVQSIYSAPDPAAALFEWWDNNGGDEFRQQVMEQLGGRRVRDDRQERSQRRVSRQQQVPQYEYRGPKPMRSLNSASGSNAHRNVDQREFDGSDASIFDYATKR